MKKLLIGLFACLLVISASTAALAANDKSSQDFSDLKDLDEATRQKFDALIEAGVFNGMGEDYFGLKEEMNRAQFAKVAALIFQLEVDAGQKTSSFTDVRADDPANGYALPYIEAIKAAGITDGVADGVFNPAGKVTKEQLATFLIRGLGQDADAKQTPGVNDSTVSDWAKGYVALALEQKLLNNNDDGTFGGKSNVIREQLVLTAYETKQVVDAAAEPSPTPEATPEPTPSASPSASPSPTPAPTPAPYYPPPITYAPAITGFTVEPGSVAGSTRIMYEPESSDRYLQIVVSANPVARPALGAYASSYGQPYVPGRDITGVTAGSYIGLYEVSSDLRVVKFVNIALTAENVTEGVPALTGYLIRGGTFDGSTKIYYPELDLYHRLFLKINYDGPNGVPAVGTRIDEIIGLDEYLPGDDIYAMPGTHIGLYVVDMDNKVVKFANIVLSADDIFYQEPAEAYAVIQPLYSSDSEIGILFHVPLSGETTNTTDITPLISDLTVNDVSVDLPPELSVSWSFTDGKYKLTLSGLQSSLFSAGAIVSITFETITNDSGQIILDATSTIDTVVQAPN